MTEASKDVNPEVLEGFELQRIPHIHYQAPFGEFLIEMLIDLGKKFNAI